MERIDGMTRCIASGSTNRLGIFSILILVEEERRAIGISFEIEDSSGTNSSNIAVPADGVRPRCTRYLDRPTSVPRLGDSTLRLFCTSSRTVWHPFTCNGTGLGLNMGAGWARLVRLLRLALLSEPNDDPLGTYTVSGYLLTDLARRFFSNYYYGIRRFPIALRASLGPNGLPHDPLTFRYLNNDCNALIGTTEYKSQQRISAQSRDRDCRKL
jgi:hypothetical protein